MQLIELFENNLKKGYIPIKDITRLPKLNKSKAEWTDSGIQAVVAKFAHQPAAVVKHAYILDLSDPYLEFLNLAIEHEGNPFFPKIYNSVILRSTIKNRLEYTLIVQMERLHPVEKAKEAITSQFDQLGFNEAIEASGLLKPDEQYDIMFFLDNYFGSSKFRNTLMNVTPNDQLKNALNALEPLFQKYSSDLHSDNIMLRLSNSGPQLVIIDPVMPPDGFEW